MKKILTILGTITLIATSTTSLVACYNTEYTLEELSELKDKNSKIINNNKLEGIASQEKSFKQSDNKGYFVIGRGVENADGRIVKFKNNVKLSSGYVSVKLDGLNNRNLFLRIYGYKPTRINLHIYEEKFIPFHHGGDKSNNYFKSVYRGDGKGEPKTLIIDPKTGKITDGKEDKEVIKEDKEVIKEDKEVIKEDK